MQILILKNVSHDTRKTWLLVTNRDEESSTMTLIKQENSEIIKYKRVLRLHSDHIWGVSQIYFWLPWYNNKMAINSSKTRNKGKTNKPKYYLNGKTSLGRSDEDLQRNCPLKFSRYSESPLYGHPLNTDTRILWTVSFVPTRESSYIFSKI